MSERGLSGEECASLVMEVVPVVMRFLRNEMRRYAGPHLTVPQFRTLAYVGRNSGTTLSEVAEHLGITLPSMSRLVDRLVERGLMTRETRPEDRRCLALLLTKEGESVLEAARDNARAEVAKALTSLLPEQRQAVWEGLSILKGLFSRRSPG